MAYAQWVSVKIVAVDIALTIKDVNIGWGKLYRDNMDNEIAPGSVEGSQIKAGESYTLSACGRESATSGTDGSFNLYDGTTLVGRYSWDCPWSVPQNKSDWTPASDSYAVTQSGACLRHDAIGNVTLTIAKK